jgi:hypothetical protein
MTDAGYVIAAYAVIIGGLALYAASVVRRLASKRDQRDEGR